MESVGVDVEQVLINLGQEIVKAFFLKKSFYLLETERGIREHKGDSTVMGLAPSGVDGIAAGSVIATFGTVPFLSSAGGSLASKLYAYVTNRWHRDKAKSVTTLLGPKSPEEDSEEFYKTLKTVFVEATVEFMVAYQTQVIAIGGHPLKWKRNFQRLASALTSNVMNVVNELTPEEFTDLKGRLDAPFFTKAFIEGARLGFKQQKGQFLERLSFGKLPAGETLKVMVTNKETKWTTTGLILGSGVALPGKKYYKCKYSNVEVHGLRWPMPHELLGLDEYLVKHRFEEVRKKEHVVNDTPMDPEAKEGLIQELLVALKLKPNDDKEGDGDAEGQKKDKPHFVVYNKTTIVPTYTERTQKQSEAIEALKNFYPLVLVNLHGVGGNGKTQIAQKIFSLAVEDHELFDGNCIFFNAERKEELESQFKELLAKCGYPHSSFVEEMTIDKMKDALYCQVLKGQKFLLIFDNVTDFQMVKNYLPKPTHGMHHKGSILLTSKQPLYKGEYWKIQNITLDVFTNEEATNYIKKFKTDVTKEQLKEVFGKTSRIPADLSLICHSFAYKKEHCSESYSWEYHLRKYGDIPKIRDNPKSDLPGVQEGVDYSASTRRNVAFSIELLDTIDGGAFSIFILKNLAFCHSQGISRKEFAHRHPSFLRQATEPEEINHALALLTKFGFIQEQHLDDDDVVYSIHQSYQFAIIMGMLDASQPSWMSPEIKNILVGHLGWLQLQENITNSFLEQKASQGTYFWEYIKQNEALLKTSTKTRDMLVSLCASGDTCGVQICGSHCDSNEDFVAMLLDNKNDDESIYYYWPALQVLYTKISRMKINDLSLLGVLVKTVAASLDKINEEGPPPSTHNQSSSLTKEYILQQMLLVAYRAVVYPPAFSLIVTNFPLLNLTEQLPISAGRTLLHEAVTVKQTSVVVELIDLVRSRNGPQGVKLFLDKTDDAGWTVVFDSVILGLPDILEVLLNGGADAGIPDPVHGQTPLHYAISRIRLDMERWAKEKASTSWPGLELDPIAKLSRLRKANPSQWDGDDDHTPILNEYDAALLKTQQKWTETIELLLRSGTSDVDAEDMKGLTPFQCAMIPRNLISFEMTESLLRAGASVDKCISRSEFNLTPLHYAIILHQPPSLELVELLVTRYKANPSIKAKSGKRPVDYLNAWKNNEEFNPKAEKDYLKMFQLLSVAYGDDVGP